MSTRTGRYSALRVSTGRHDRPVSLSQVLRSGFLPVTTFTSHCSTVCKVCSVPLHQRPGHSTRPSDVRQDPNESGTSAGFHPRALRVTNSARNGTLGLLSVRQGEGGDVLERLRLPRIPCQGGEPSRGAPLRRGGAPLHSPKPCEGTCSGRGRSHLEEDDDPGPGLGSRATYRRASDRRSGSQ